MPTDDLESFCYLFVWFAASILRYHDRATMTVQALLNFFGESNMWLHCHKLDLLRGWDGPIFKELILTWTTIALAVHDEVTEFEDALVGTDPLVNPDEYQAALDNMFNYSKGVYDRYLTTGFDFLRKMDECQAW